MPNPRYFKDEKPTGELEFKLQLAHYVYTSTLKPFCKSFCYEHELENLRKVEGVYLIGSHAKDTGWKNETSDIDFKLFIPDMLPAVFTHYKRIVLDQRLLIGEKKDWIDVYAVNKLYKITEPRFDLTELWNKFKMIT